MGDTRRTRRLASLIRGELGLLLLRKIKDPRLGLVSITGVDVSPDMSQAKVFYSLLDDRDQKEVQKGFVRAAGFLRRELAHKLNLKSMPRLVPVYDASLKEGMEMDALIRRVRAGDKANSPEEEDAK